MSLKTELTEIVGSRYVLDSPDALERYSRDHSLVLSRKPNYVVQPKDADEVQRIINWANEHKVPVIPSSSGIHFNGATVPKQGGIILDLSRMNRILEIDRPNRKAKIEPGVTWEQLQTELEKQDFMAVIPLLPHSQRSVLTDYLEREVPVTSIYDFAEPLLAMEVVWPNGDRFRTGSASVPNFPNSYSQGANPLGPGALDFFRFLQGAQGTMGVVT